MFAAIEQFKPIRTHLAFKDPPRFHRIDRHRACREGRNAGVEIAIIAHVHCAADKLIGGKARAVASFDLFEAVGGKRPANASVDHNLRAQGKHRVFSSERSKAGIRVWNALKILREGRSWAGE